MRRGGSGLLDHRRDLAVRRAARGVRRAHQGRLAAVHADRRSPRAQRLRAGHAGRDRAHRVRDHAEEPGRGVPRRPARPTSRTRCRAWAGSASTCTASAGASASCCGACSRRSPASTRSGCRPSVRRLAENPRGLVLVTGPTGSGKTTTLAAMVDHINSTMSAPHRDDRGSDRGPARRQAVDRQPARGRHRHRRLRRRVAAGAAPGPRRHPHR